MSQENNRQINQNMKLEMAEEVAQAWKDKAIRIEKDYNLLKKD